MAPQGRCECSSCDANLDITARQVVVGRSIPDAEIDECAGSEGSGCCDGGVRVSTETHPCAGSCCGSEQVSVRDIEAMCADERCSPPAVIDANVPAGGIAACAADCCGDTTPMDSCAGGCCFSENGTLKADKWSSSTTAIDSSLPAAAVACIDSCCSDGPTLVDSCGAGCCKSDIGYLKAKDTHHTGAVGADECCSQSSHRHSSGKGKKPCTLRRRNHNHCASDVFGRFYEVACCCVFNSVKRRIHAANCKRRPATDNRPPKSSKVVFNGRRDINQIERSGNDHMRPMMMSVQGMDCQSCATRVTKALLTIPSVTDPKVSTFSGQVTLTYLEGAVTPESIVRRTATLTGFHCELQSITVAAQEKRILVQVRTTDNLYDAKLPVGVIVKSMQKHESGGAILEVEYDSWITQPRTVVSAFAPWHGVHVPRSPTEETDEAKKTLMDLLQRTIISIICCIPVLVLSWAPIPRRPIVYGSVSLVLTTIIQFYVAAPLYSSAFRSLFLQRMMDMDLLVVLSTSIAYILSVVAFGMEVAHHPSMGEFFETSSLLVTLIMGGSLASAYARRRTSSAVDSLAALQVRTVELVNVDDGLVTPLSGELVHIGDIVRVLPDTTVPTDGFVVSGASEVDESSITGESILVGKRKGSKVIAGTLNLSGLLNMSVERVPSENTVAGITQLMREAQDSRLPVQDLPDKIASYLAPGILIMSIITFLTWLLVGLYVRHESGSNAAINALKYAIAVMVISCPCAILLAVPMVIVISVAVCAKHGILFKTIQAIQIADEISVAVFDKTGTLTEGKLHVVRSHILRDDTIPLVFSLTSNSRHPVANAVAAHLLATSATNRGISIELKDIQSIAGKGLEAVHANLPLRGGNPKWLQAEDYSMVHELLEKGLTPFVATHGEQLIAVFGLADTIRQGSQETVNLIRRGGAEVYIVSGDEQAVVNDVAARLGVPLEHAFGNCTPQSKQEHVKRLQTTSRRRGAPKVAFFGDGTNDSLALVQADIGISFGDGTDVALNAADVIILDPSNMARSIQTILRVSRGALLRIKMNFVWSFVYNLVAVLFAGGAFVHARISPQYAGLGELVSVMPVILIAWTMWLLRV